MSFGKVSTGYASNPEATAAAAAARAVQEESIRTLLGHRVAAFIEMKSEVVAAKQQLEATGHGPRVVCVCV